MYTTYGSLAVKPKASLPARRPTRPAAPAAVPAKSAARPAPSAPERGRVLCAGETATRRRCKAERVRAIAVATVLVLAFTTAAVLLLVRQSAVMKAGFAVATMQSDARDLDVDTQVVEEKIAAATDLTAIRALAIARLGMQDPSSLQRIVVELPPSDRLLLSSGSDADGTAAAESDALLRNAMGTLEGFFRTLR